MEQKPNGVRAAVVVLAVALASGCAHLQPAAAAPDRTADGASTQMQRQVARRSSPTVFPGHTMYGSTKSIPAGTIADLPRRIRTLRRGVTLTISDLVGLLGLSRHRSNVSINMRWNHHFVYLDDDHILYMTIDVMHHDSEPFLVPWDAPVIACKLMRNPDVTVIERDLGLRKMLDEEPTGANRVSVQGNRP